MFDIEQPAYKSLRDIISERTNRVVVWMGSGLSREAGIPAWSVLRDKLCTNLENHAKGIEEYYERQSLQAKAKKARDTHDYWVAFQILKESMGQTSYRSTIREAFIPADRCTIPEIYKLIWRLPLDGILNLNLDRLATRAHSEIFAGRTLNEFTGKQVSDHTHVLKGSVPFIVNLHGIVADESSWVLNNAELKGLFKNLGYLQFISLCLCTKTVIFIGITADDKAVNNHLETLKDKGIDFGAHYWITNRRDKDTYDWAESAGIRTISYYSEKDDHCQLKEFLNDLQRFMPKDTQAPPVQMESSPEEASMLPTPSELRKVESEEVIRIQLNAHAKKILYEQNEGAYTRYNEFCKQYDHAIYRAWYVTTESPNNTLLGYKIIEEIAEGAFGRVFRAEAPDGKEVALKLLKADVRRKPDMLQSFRRGVRSMRILSSHNVHGMVPYREASEIPAFVIMKFVQGPNLQQAVESQYVNEWSIVLRIAVDLANIIRRAHLLPERVLHRDIRPANIMLEGYYTEPSEWKLVVLDFDLSWHMGAKELSVIDPSTISGFLAPEQVERIPNTSTRNAAVDSFGLGMTLFYIRTGKQPQHLQHLHESWINTLLQSISYYKCSSWHSVPNRFARLIEKATLNKQSERWDMSQIEGELELLKEAESNPYSVQSAELLAEEIAARTSEKLNSPKPYEWNSDLIQASISLPSGVRLHLIPQETKRRIEVNFSWTSVGTVPHKKIRKYLPKACNKSLSGLRRVGWQSKGAPTVRLDDADFGVEIPVNHLQRDLGPIADSLARAINELLFD